MKCIDGTNNLSRVEFCPLFIESLIPTEVSEELATVQEVDKEIEFTLRLESIMQTYDIWVFDLLEDVTLG